VIASRAEIPVEEAARRLEKMVKKGLISYIHREGKPPLYTALQFLAGIWEGQVNKLSLELAQDAEEYMPTYIGHSFWQALPQMRTIPVGKSISTQTEVMSYERAEELVRIQKTSAVSNCICRQEQRILGKGCDKPEESCLAFGMAAEIMVRTGRGRTISQEEALAILHRAEEVGLVLQPSNAKKALFICTCCGCCCGALRSLKRHPEPASVVYSPFLASLNTDTCQGCGTCVERCQMEAIHLADSKAALDLNRCIGCGLCVTTCPANALSLTRKPEEKQPYVPKDIMETHIRLGKARGKLGTGKRMGMQDRSR
jgi:NAD-dependent dihydropyrimidine dehydrogenase PreA subunit